MSDTPKTKVRVKGMGNMSGPFIPSFERDRRERCTPDKIVEIAQQRGEFRVSLRYRDDWLRERCFKLMRAKRLSGGRRNGREIVFYASEPTK